MKVLQYCDWFKEYTGNLILAFGAQSPDLTLVLRQDTREFNGRRQDEAELQSKLRQVCRTVIVLPGGYQSRQALELVRRALYQHRRYAEHAVFHLQLTHDPRFLWLAWRLPTVVTVHEPGPRTGHPRQGGLRGFTKRRLRSLYRRLADVIVVHTESGQRELSPRELRKSVVIPHGVTTRDRTSPQVPEILFFGRVADYKGLDVLLAAMDEVWKVRPDARLRILANPGDGVGDRDRVYDPRIRATWDGYSNHDLETALTTARVVCLPYLSASGSGVAAEAIGAGKVIVASDLEDLRGFAPHPDLLAKPGCATDLARALVAALSSDYQPVPLDPQRTWPEVARAHLRVYE
ncbi:MAG: glycosyltransferase family 4 protein, partial [Mycobacterium sp.]|nr:glycosyltransferase family 4 protein [Mycobacterium sp.]